MPLDLYCLYAAQKRTFVAEGEQTQVYITDSTFVYISPHLPIERARTTVPLKNNIIVTVFGHGHVLTVNIKPTSPEVIINNIYPSGEALYSSYATRSIRIEQIKNASGFAEEIQCHIKN